MKNIREADLTDKKDQILISPGLKVRHKKSKFEYTVDSVVKDKSGKIVVLLRKPDVGRFGPVNKQKPATDKTPNNGVIYEAEPIDDFSTSYYAPEGEDEDDDDLIAVPVEQFEKEYNI